MRKIAIIFGTGIGASTLARQFAENNPETVVLIEGEDIFEDIDPDYSVGKLVRDRIEYAIEDISQIIYDVEMSLRSIYDIFEVREASLFESIESSAIMFDPSSRIRPPPVKYSR